MDERPGEMNWENRERDPALESEYPGQRDAASRRNRTPEEIRAEIEETRAEMSETVDSIQERLAPERLKEQAVDTVREATIGRVEQMASSASEKARGAGSSLMDTIRRNPIPSALAAVGIGWLLMERRSTSYEPTYRGAYRYETQYYPQGRTSDSGVQRKAQQVTDQAQELGQQAKVQAQELGQQAKEQAQQLSEEARYRAEQVKSRFEELLDKNPLAVGAAAMALGAVIGLGLPETQKEHEIMGPARDQLFEKAQATAEDTMEKVKKVAEESKETVQQEARKQNLPGT